MHLKSTLNPLSKSEGSIPVAIFSFGDRQMFLRVFEDYWDMLRHIIESFELEEDVVLSLRTSTIDACQGMKVEIGESAYSLLWKFLDTVEVVIVEQVSVGRCQQKGAPDKNHAIAATFLQPSSDETEHPRTPVPDDIGEGLGGSFQVTDGKSDEDRLENHKVARKRLTPLKTAELRQTSVLEDNGEGGSSLEKKFRPAGALFPKSNKEIGSPTKIRRENTVESHTQVEIGSPTKIKKEKLAEPPSYEEARTKDPEIAPQPEADSRFEITINGPKNETAQFKTRGKHPVRKVLAAACKTFGIKYERARLILCVSTEEGGEIQTDEFDCPTEETMSQCGVDGSAKLFVRVEPGHDNDSVFEEE